MTTPVLRIGIDYRPAILTGAGIGRSVRELCRALAAAEDIELRLFGHSFGRARRSDPLPAGARLHRLPIPGRSLPLLARLGLDANRLCGGVSLFHWTDYIHPPVRRGEVVLTVHDLAFAADPDFHGPTTGWLMQRCKTAAARSSHVLCPTRATAGHVERELGLPRDRITVVPWGSDHVPRSPGANPMTEPYLLTVGTIEPRKNHRRLLAAWRALPAPRPRLVVLGRRGWECDETLAELQRAVRDEGVIWREDASDAEVYRFMAHAVALAYPSRFEGFGFPPLEAMALGTPVVAGDTPALREVLGDAATWCDPTDTDSLRAALLSAAAASGTDRGRREREQAARFTWAATARAHARVYREVVAG